MIGTIGRRISTRPDYESYTWGDNRSILAWAIYNAFFILRIFSPLQIRKFHFRYQLGIHHGCLTCSKRSSEHTERPDFHARNTENYMFLVAGISSASYLLFKYHAYWAVHLPKLPFGTIVLSAARNTGNVLLILLLIESLQWTFYYLLLRPLIERRHDIYDSAEYLIVLPIVLFNQVFLLATLSRTAPTLILCTMFNISTNHAIPGLSAVSRIFVSLIGITYQVVIVSSLIRVIPAIPVRKRPNITVIGFGDVVQRRILPALRSMYQPSQIAVAADFIDKKDREILRSFGIQYFSAGTKEDQEALHSSGSASVSFYNSLERIRDFIKSRSSFAIVAVPTQYHLEYSRMLEELGIRFAIEKPVVFSEAELTLIHEHCTVNLFKNAFVLSYYWLEKALPLNYFLTLNPRVASLIQQPCDPREIVSLHQRLGSLLSVAVDFVETGETEERAWTEQKSTGGMVGETLIHPLTLAMQFALPFQKQQAELWAEAPQIRWFRNQERAKKFPEISATAVELHGKISCGASVFIRCGKYFQRRRRTALAVYEGGYVTADLDSRVVRAFLKTPAGSELKLTIAPVAKIERARFNPEAHKLLAAFDETATPARRINYQLQMDLVSTFFSNGWGGMRFDDYPSQLKVIRELLLLAKELPEDEAARACDVSPDALSKDAIDHPLIRDRNVAIAPHEFQQPDDFLLTAME